MAGTRYDSTQEEEGQIRHLHSLLLEMLRDHISPHPDWFMLGTDDRAFHEKRHTYTHLCINISVCVWGVTIGGQVHAALPSLMRAVLLPFEGENHFIAIVQKPLPANSYAPMPYSMHTLIAINPSSFRREHLISSLRWTLPFGASKSKLDPKYAAERVWVHERQNVC